MNEADAARLNGAFLRIETTQEGLDNSINRLALLLDSFAERLGRLVASARKIERLLAQTLPRVAAPTE